MKDSYTLDASWEGLDRGYDLHAQAYRRIFTRCGLRFFEVGASSGAMGGTGSQEFMVESDAGEDVLALAEDGSYAANVEVATSLVEAVPRVPQHLPLEEVPTPNVKTIDELIAFLKVDERRLAKSVVYWADETPVLVLMSGNDELNESKLMSVMGTQVYPVEDEKLVALTGADGGSIGPVGLRKKTAAAAKFRIVADKRLEGANNLISGANRNDYHIMNIDLQRDCEIDGYFDLRSVKAGEISPNGQSTLRIVRGIELGHIFKLGTKYSDSLGAMYLDESGKQHPIIMGSYGIGIERIIACHIEQSHDANGIIWDKSIAPYHFHLIAVGTKSKSVVEAAEGIYRQMNEEQMEVLFDDRLDVSPGFKFKDADLLGMPYQVIVGEKNLANGKIEVKDRRTGERTLVVKEEILSYLKGLLA